MGSVSARMSAVFAVGFCLTGPGCIHVHTDPEGHVKSVEMKVGDGLSAMKSAGGKDDVKQVAGTTAMPATPTAPTIAPPSAAPSMPIGARLAALRPSLPRLASFVKPSTPVAEITALWQNRIAYLPDPTRSGAPGAGLVGELFLIGAGPKMPFADADGKVTFSIYDESRGVAASERLGSWTFDKDTLARLVSVDERLGKCYAVFLPWPEYRPTIKRVRLTTRYEPENGHALFATTWVNFDNGPVTMEQAWKTLPSPVASPAPSQAGGQPAAAEAGSYPVAPAAPAEAAPSYPPPIPLSGPIPGNSAAPPSRPMELPPPTELPRPTELPPLSITLPGRP